MRVEVRYWAALRAVAGCKEETVEVADETTLDDLVQSLIEEHDAPGFTRIIEGCSVLIDGRSVARAARAETVVAKGQRVEFLPPFAGG